jgi:hypothetical protein
MPGLTGAAPRGANMAYGRNRADAWSSRDSYFDLRGLSSDAQSHQLAQKFDGFQGILFELTQESRTVHKFAYRIFSRLCVANS